MPIYEYHCAGCDQTFEVTQKISEPPLKKHECGSKKVKRLISQTAFHLKGSGWYATDYVNKGSQAPINKDSKDPTHKDSQDSKNKEPAKTSESSSTKENAETKKQSSATSDSAEKKKAKTSSAENS